MSTACAPHREYLAALADGEVELVPATTFSHVESCGDCAREIRAHQLLKSRLRQAAGRLEADASDRPARAAVRSRIDLIAGGVAAAVLLAAAGAGWLVLSRPDPVQAALTASSRPTQIESTDPTQVGQWCRQASGRTVPAIQLDGMQVVGARMDRVDSTDIVTLVYVAPSGARVTVSWLEGRAQAASGVEDRNLSGRQLLVVHSTVGTAVITGSSAEAMWQTAAAIESAAP